MNPEPQSSWRELPAAFMRSVSYLIGSRMVLIRGMQESDLVAALTVINHAARSYRGVIPADRWHEPYMPRDELDQEIADGVAFWLADEEGSVLGVMGMQDKGEVALVRHAYIAPAVQRKGVGTIAPTAHRKPCKQAHSDWHLGRRVMGHRVLSSKWLYSRLQRAKGQVAPHVLGDPGEADQHVGSPCGRSMDGIPARCSMTLTTPMRARPHSMRWQTAGEVGMFCRQRARWAALNYGLVRNHYEE